MASIIPLQNLLEDIQQPKYLRSIKARTSRLAEINKAAHVLRKSQLECVGRKFVHRLMLAVRFGRMNYRTFYKLVDALRVHEITSVYFLLHNKILAFVRQNKYKARWFMIFLLKLRHKRDGDTKRLQDIFLERYLTPSADYARIDSTFLNMFLQEFPQFDRNKLFRHLIRYKKVKDTFGKSVLATFFEVCPEFSKYAILG